MSKVDTRRPMRSALVESLHDFCWRSKMRTLVAQHAQPSVSSLGHLREVAGLCLCLALAAWPRLGSAQALPVNLPPNANGPCRPGWTDRTAVPVKVTNSLILSVPVKYIRYELLTCGETTGGIPRDGPDGSTLVSFDFFMPDFSGYTIARLQKRFDVDQVRVGYIVSPAEIEPHPGHPTNYPDNQLKNILRYIANPRKYHDMYGLRCYEGMILKTRMYCYSASAGKEHKGILFFVTAPPYAPGIVNPQMSTNYLADRYGGIEIAWSTNVRNLSHWREIDSQIWQFIDTWNVARNATPRP